ncbi:MAG TPA: MetQ/NlpA family ABC transporter substrate-binding protein [Flexilinea sp.]|nr:MetQ/NlpA family ABC transporter substrate-binding protein [Flexilinea sp.]
MKRISILICSVLLLTAMVLSGCSTNTEKATETVKATVESVATVSNVGTAKDTASEAATTEKTAATGSAVTTEETVKETAVTFSKENPITLKIGASPVPHAEILAQIKEPLAEKGINLEVVEFTDYIQPNIALEDGSLDANFFQHFPYLDDFNKNQKKENADWTTLVPLVYVHFEPMGIYKGKTASLDALKEGAKIAVPNDPTNEARALLLLEANGLLKIAEGKGLEATAKDIVDNPKKFEIVELEAAQVALSIQDVDIAVVNGNYALSSGLTQADILAQESSDSEAAKKYANLVAVREGEEDLPQFVLLKEAITSDAVKKFIEEKYKGSVAPVF